MEKEQINNILEQLLEGQLSQEEALDHLSYPGFDDLGYAKVDHDRLTRQGMSEVIYASGKTPEQIRGICLNLAERGESNILLTRLSPAKAEKLKDLELDYQTIAQLAVFKPQAQELRGNIIIATGGTSDLPVAEEAAITAETLGSKVTRLYDVGVAGVHRILAQKELLDQARVVIAVAGMEGALASVVGGLVACPVIAVPTSVGYGASFNGLAALLSMLTACASGIGVVNIDNGFGAAVLAHRINTMTACQD
ncbi:MAG: nickel pincer cofactor biosynthesis protein LarB [Eubacteriales bacterium]|nr:nickel pincer cofactor biosynthesis protein LarB [Eubacteriales bacterium]